MFTTDIADNAYEVTQLEISSISQTCGVLGDAILVTSERPIISSPLYSCFFSLNTVLFFKLNQLLTVIKDGYLRIIMLQESLGHFSVSLIPELD